MIYESDSGAEGLAAGEPDFGEYGVRSPVLEAGPELVSPHPSAAFVYVWNDHPNALSDSYQVYGHLAGFSGLTDGLYQVAAVLAGRKNAPLPAGGRYSGGHQAAIPRPDLLRSL